MLAFSEGVLLAEKSGIAREVAVDVLTHSVIGSPMVQYRGPIVLNMPDEAWFDVNMMQKDMLLALEMGRQLDVPLPTTAVDQRDADGGARHGPGEEGFRDRFRGARPHGRSAEMSVATKKQASSSGIGPVPLENLLHMYRQMVAIRLFEERVNDLYTRALMPGLAHLYIGEEAIAVGICEALTRDDYITSTHRGHGHCLAKGAAPDRMFAELLGKEAGYCKGKGGSMHIADPDTGNLGANAIVGGSAGIATGAAFSSKYLGNKRVDRVLLRGRRARSGPPLRGDEPRTALEAAGHLRLREQLLQRVHALFGDRRPVSSVPGRRVRHRRRRRSTARMSATSTPAAAPLIARAREGDGPAFM